MPVDEILKCCHSNDSYLVVLYKVVLTILPVEERASTTFKQKPHLCRSCSYIPVKENKKSVSLYEIVTEINKPLNEESFYKSNLVNPCYNGILIQSKWY